MNGDDDNAEILRLPTRALIAVSLKENAVYVIPEPDLATFKSADLDPGEVHAAIRQSTTQNVDSAIIVPGLVILGDAGG